ncbi:hypothetical protein [Paenibacillus macquariensis]|uniref:Uncharacterized protein n=1 Tax=Paenibacillus macquariensis TaxID=948756 RepID=A0ABY1JSC9_9BACL|nr:hypothetical protein [Paenibacillus macquariensis]MEC0092897.1 hypothetical protein [Paenibacillus macquariensis]OAB36268.1 hypothetical protein PMSM_07420 [Paenibacillus macquariensis subsp. macquariensis]SIQ68340.1 hypothetical protein SAMN05421578_103351 [Paenibacillus macquariensis]
MHTLVIYDGTGYIISQMNGDVREPIGLPFLWIEVPEKKRLVSVDVSVTPNVPIFEDVPLTEIEQLRLETAQGNAELFEMVLLLTGGVA